MASTRVTTTRSTATRPTATRPTARLVLAGGAVALLALVAGPAAAAPAGTVPATTTADITAAVQTSPATAAVLPAEYAVTGVRTAATDGDWAAAAIEPTGEVLDPATVVLHRVDGSWTVVDLGTAQVGCDTAPATVVTDLGLLC